MADMTVHEALEQYGPSSMTVDDFLLIDDPAWQAENVAIVTGAANGIGRATALALAANGLCVVGVDVDEDGLAEVESKAEDLAVLDEFVTVTGDLTEDADLERVVETAADHGSIRYLANIAGIQHVSPISEFPLSKYDEMHALMQRAPLVLTKRCWPHFEANDDGCGVVGNMCSVHGHIVTRDKVAYNSTKFGLRGLTQSIAAEGRGKIRSFTASTGYVKTELVAKQLPDTANRRDMTVNEVVENVILGQTRVKEMMEPHEAANIFVMGFSKHSKHLNGGDMTYDGGMSLTY